MDHLICQAGWVRGMIIVHCCSLFILDTLSEVKDTETPVSKAGKFCWKWNIFCLISKCIEYGKDAASGRDLVNGKYKLI